MTGSALPMVTGRTGDRELPVVMSGPGPAWVELEAGIDPRAPGG